MKKQGKYNEAMILFAEALRINPNFVPARKNMKKLSLDTAMKQHKVKEEYFPENAIVKFLVTMCERLAQPKRARLYHGLIDTRNLFMFNDWQLDFYKKIGRNQYHDFREEKNPQCDIFDLGVVLLSMCNLDYLDITRYLETEEPIKIPVFYCK